MKKASSDALRSEYKRSDFGKLVRGKYAARASAGPNIVILEPAVAKAFPSDKAVNDALTVSLAFGSAKTWLPDFHRHSYVPCPAHTFRFTRRRSLSRGTGC